MNSVLQVAAAASRHIASAQAVVTNNLANASATGFKSDMFYAQGGYTQPGVEVQGGETAVDFRPGSIVQTGNDLDIAIVGEGWMQVITPAGEEVLSRRGDLRINIDGDLIDATGNQILGDGGPINLPPSSSITIGSDGVISYIPIGETALGRVTQGRISLVNPDPATLTKGIDGHIRAEAGANLEPSANVQISVGALETSNVNSIAAMVEMIELARSFESHVQTMKSADELDGSSASLMRLE